MLLKKLLVNIPNKLELIIIEKKHDLKCLNIY